MEEITVTQLKEKIEKEESILLLDVRDEFETHISSLGGTHVPLNELEDRLDELDPEKGREIVALCRSGSRSAEAVRLLESNGFENVKNLKGGINEWAKEIDPSLQVY